MANKRKPKKENYVVNMRLLPEEWRGMIKRKDLLLVTHKEVYLAGLNSIENAKKEREVI